MSNIHNIRTRFAPSPTGFIHLGNIRSALYPWAFARHCQGKFILRIEDTDLERSSQEAVDVILQGMEWLGLNFDEGPFYQTQRMDRYKQVIQQMLDNGLAYYCYTTPEELDAMREAQQLAKQKPKYDGTWRPEENKTLPAIPQGVKPVIRFKNPLSGLVTWQDAVKGQISIANEELDDFIIARTDGMPTYNFCVVVDDIDMEITHVIRGDDHVNNTPRQINLLTALGKSAEQIPVYGHLPTVLNEAGEKMSKRNGAMHVMSYAEEGYLPQAIVNYLARLGWSHGNDEIFSVEQFVEWFDLNHLGASATQFNGDKLKWLNAHYIKQTSNADLLELVKPFFEKCNYDLSAYSTKNLELIVSLLKDRSSTLKELAQNASIFYITPSLDNISTELNNYTSVENVNDAIKVLKAELGNLDVSDWQSENIAKIFKQVLAQFSLKMPALAMPVRLLTVGSTHTPAIDKVLQILGKDDVISRL
ncbi:MAG: Glutamate--tRNA ligase [Pseudomonadota bacterium]|jgi:glutamyl-tRNA synthetase